MATAAPATPRPDIGAGGVRAVARDNWLSCQRSSGSTARLATVVAACLEGRVPPDREIQVHLPGGNLFITVASGPADSDGPTFAGVSMRGPANVVFEASLDPSAIHLPAQGKVETRAISGF